MIFGPHMGFLYRNFSCSLTLIILLMWKAVSRAQVQNEAIPAGAKKGHIVLMKHETSKHFRRDLYIVLDTDDSSQTLAIAKLPHAISGSRPMSFQPHNVTYIVKQTDIFLSPNQPTIIHEHPTYSFEEIDEVETEVFKSNVEPTYPYDDDDDDTDYEDFEVSDDDDDIDEDDDIDDDEVSSNYNSATDGDNDADNEETGDQQSSSSNLPESDQDSILEENIINREIEVNNLIEEPDGAAALEQQEEVQCDQSRLPKRGDIISFVLEDIWVIAKVLNKAKSSNHYNAQWANPYRGSVGWPSVQ